MENNCCTFLGHKDCPFSIKPKLYDVLEDLIKNKNVTTFYVGNHGNFDNIASSALFELKNKYEHIQYNIVLAYLPTNSNNIINSTMYPEGIETVPKRFAISWRNRFMISKSNYIICYIAHGYGGAYKFAKYALNQNKTIINLYNEFKI